MLLTGIQNFNTYFLSSNLKLSNNVKMNPRVIEFIELASNYMVFC